jgi:hypothetical protein
MPSLPALSLVAIVHALACTPAAPPPAPSPAPPPTPEPAPTVLSVTAPGSETLDLQATAIDCGWGSVGPVAVGAAQPYWVIAVVDLRAGRDATGLTLAELELFDAEARSLGRADRELELRMTTPDGTAYTGNDAPFDGTLTAGRSVRLKIRARMEDAFAARVETTQPATYRVTLRSAAGAIIRISGPVGGPWPTA